MRYIYGFALLLAAGPALAGDADKPAPSEPGSIDLHLSAEQVRAFGPVLDAAIRGSGYSQTAASALMLGQAVEAAQRKASGRTGQ